MQFCQLQTIWPLSLPSQVKKKLIRKAARTRKQLDVNMPPIPVARNFEIPEIFDHFIRCDSGANDHERIILCGDPEMLRVLEKSFFWLADGTFKITPKSSISYIQFMLVYLALRQLAFTPSFLTKPQKTYNRFLQALIDLAPNCRPEKFLLDFEQAALQSFQKNIPRSTFIGLFFPSLPELHEKN